MGGPATTTRGNGSGAVRRSGARSTDCRAERAGAGRAAERGDEEDSVAGADEAAFVRDDHGLRAVADAELGEDAVDMGLHGRLPEVELRGDLRVRAAVTVSVEQHFDPGTYVIACLMPDMEKDGTPHAMEGMITSFTVS